MLGLRMREELPVATLGERVSEALAAQVAGERVVVRDGRVRLTRTGRLFADAVVRALSG